MKVLGAILSLLAMICYLLIIAVLAIAAPMAAGYKPVVVLTGSMEPTYPVGSVIYYKSSPFDSIQVGDVISFSVNSDSRTVVTHRVFEKDPAQNQFIVKGDANASPDTNPIPFANVKGKVMLYKIPFAGFFVQYVQNFAVIGAIVAVLLAKILFDFISDRKQPTENNVS